MSDQEPITEFALRGTLSAVQIMGIVIAVGIACLVMLIALRASGVGDTQDTVGAFVLLLILLGGMGWKFRLFGRGIVRLTPERLEIRAKSGAGFYRWSHIRTIDLFQPSGAWIQLMTLWTAPQNSPIVRIRLARSRRLGLTDRFGTDIVGIPSLIGKTVLLSVDDPEGFLRAAQRFLGSTPPTAGSVKVP